MNAPIARHSSLKCWCSSSSTRPQLMSLSGPSKNPSKDTDTIRMIFRIWIPPSCSGHLGGAVVAFSESLQDSIEQVCVARRGSNLLGDLDDRPAAKRRLKSDQVPIRVLHEELNHAGLGLVCRVPLRLRLLAERPAGSAESV